MSTSRRSLRDIRTLGHRHTPAGDHQSLLRASILEAELQRLHQESRLLRQRLRGLAERSAELEAERDSLLDGLSGRQRPQRRNPPRNDTFPLRY